MEPNKPFDIVLSDLWTCLRYKKRLILLCSLLIASFALYYAIDRNVVYVAEATFRDRGKADAGMRQTVADYIFGSVAEKNDSEVVSAMKSSRLIEAVVKKLSLQGSISEKGSSFQFLKRLHDHTLSEWAFWTRRKTPILTETVVPLKLIDINYLGEIPEHLSITFLGETEFVFDSGERGILGEPFKFKNGSFTIVPLDSSSLKGKTFNITFNSISSTVKNLLSNIVANQDQDDRTLVKLKYYDTDRKRAAQFINELMASYQDFLEEEHDRINSKQLDYLKKREEEMALSLKEVMEKHAQKVEKGLSANGFTNTQKELEFLTHQMMVANQKMMEIDLEKKRLTSVVEGDFAAYDPYNPSMSDAKVINEILGRIRTLKMEQDALDLALKDDSFDEERFKVELRERERLVKCCNESKEVIALLDHNKTVEPHLLNDPKYMLSSWNESIKDKKRDTGLKKQYREYVSHLKRLFEMQLASIDERLHHRTSGSVDFQGITLNTAKDLYLQLTKDRQELEGQIRQIRFVLDHIDSPDFEISSLTTILTDPISLERIARGTQISLQIKDSANRTNKEIERLQDELNIQKSFLKLHLSESKKLLDLKSSLLSEKDFELKKATLEMSHRELALLEKQLEDFISTRQANLDQEKIMLTDHQSAIKTKMALIPEKWIHEQLLEQHLLRNQRMVENITGLVESKNISSNLELIQSSPLDYAKAPLFPKNPHLLIWSFIGLVGGAFITSLFVIAQGLVFSIPLTKANLSLNGYKVAGTLNYKRRDETLPPYDENLNTLRKALDFLPENSHLISLIRGDGISYGTLLFEILQKQGKKVCLLDISNKGELSLENLIKNAEANDYLYIKNDRFAFETLTSQAFDRYLNGLRQHYDMIVFNYPGSMTDATSLALIRKADASIVGLATEHLDNVKEVLNIINNEELNVIFIFNQPL